MYEQSSGQLRAISGLTQRDIVLGFLLALDTHFHEAGGSQMGLAGRPPVMEMESQEILFHLIYHSLGSIEDPRVFGLEYGYGLPDWLVWKPTGPLFLLLEKLTTEPRWKWLSEQLEREDQFDELCQLQESLEGRRADPPGQIIRDLPNTLAPAKSAQEVVATALTSSLAARAPARHGIKAAEELARAALKYRSSQIGEWAWRVIRFDFPLVVSRGTTRGVLVGAELSFADLAPRATAQVSLRNFEGMSNLLDPRGVLQSCKWKLCSDEFSDAANNGATAAINLLQKCGVPREMLERFRFPQIYLRGLLPPGGVRGASVGLPVAIEVIRRALDLPPSDWVTSGAIDESGEIEPLLREDLKAKWEAVRDDGVKRGLLAAGQQEPTIPANELQLLNHERPTLFDAAKLLWGEEWDRKLRDVQTDAISTYAFHLGWRQAVHLDCATVAGVPIVVPTREAREIADHFRDSDADFAFLGGGPKSGKTWIAQEVESNLKAAGNWTVETLSMKQFAQPSADDVIKAIRHVSNLPSPQPRRLIVLDEMEWNARLDGLEHLLRSEAQQTGVSILCVARVDRTMEWATEDCTQFRSIQSDEALEDILTQVFDRYPEMEKAKVLRGTIVAFARRDLWWIMNLLAQAAASTFSLPYQDLVAQFLEIRVPRVSERQLEHLKKIATLSLCSAYVPKEEVPAELTRYLQAIGARLIAQRGWVIESRATCDAILGAVLKDSKLTVSLDEMSRVSISPQHIESVLLGTINRGETESTIAILCRVRQYNPPALGRTWALAKEELATWAKRIAKPVQLAVLLDVLAPLLPENDLQVLVNRLAELVSLDWVRFTSHDLAFCLRVLRRERTSAEESSRGGRNEGAGRWHELMWDLDHRGLATVLASGGDSTDNLFLAEELWRTHDEAGHRALEKSAVRMVPRKPPFASQDYKLVLRLLNLVRNISFQRNAGENRHGEVHLKAACEAIANWEFPKEAGPTADQLLLRLAVRKALGLISWQWEEVVNSIGRDLRASINRSTFLQLSEGLFGLADEDRSLAVCLLDTIDIGAQLSRRQFSAGEFATLLGTISRLHVDTAYQLLYESPGRPRRNLAERLAQRIHATGDTKGAGRTLYATSKVDELFGSMNGGFARLLADRIGKKFLEVNLRRDARVSVLFYLIQGLVVTEVPFATDAWHLVCETVAESIRETLRPWAPQLALLMCESTEIGTKFIDEFVARVPEDRILAGMTSAFGIEALESFHRLGRFYPTVAARFRAFYENGSEILPRLSRDDRPDVVLRAVRAMSDTLRRAGDLQAGQRILETLNKPAKVAALRNSPTGDVASTIRLWREIDPSDAADMVHWDATKAILHDKFRRTIAEPHVGVELATAVEDVKQGSGKKLVRDFMNWDGAWKAFVSELIHDQNPVAQASALLRLCRLEALPEEKVRQRLYDHVWRLRIGTLTSPHAVTSLLKLFAAWDQQWGTEAAGKVNISRLGRRLAQACMTDLDYASGLIGTLHALGQGDSARALANILAEVKNIDERLSLETWQFLLPVLDIVHPELAEAMSVKLSDRVKRSVVAGRVIDDVGFWQTVGWIAYRCSHSVGSRGAIDIPDAPPSFLVPKDTLTCLWATTWLADAEWTSAQRDRAWRDICKRPKACRVDFRLMALVALSRNGRLNGFFSRVGYHWGRPSSASPAHLTVLLRAGLDNQELAAWIGHWSEDISGTLDRPWNRADVFTTEARRLLLSFNSGFASLNTGSGLRP